MESGPPVAGSIICCSDSPKAICHTTPFPAQFELEAPEFGIRFRRETCRYQAGDLFRWRTARLDNRGVWAARYLAVRGALPELNGLTSPADWPAWVGLMQLNQS